MSVVKKGGTFACVCFLSLSLIAGSFSHSNASISRLAQFAFIGFGAAFITNYIQRDTCNSHRERIAGAVAAGSTAATLETVFTIGGGAFGYFTDGLGGGVIGAIGGNVLGKILSQTITGTGSARAGETASAQSRDLNAEFEYQTCLILQSSNVIRQQLVKHQLAVSSENCDRPTSRDGQMTDEGFNQILYCGIRGNLSARTTNIHLIRLNQATCAAIQAVGVSIDAQTANAGGSTMPRGLTSFDPDCDNSAPQEIWQNFVRGRQ